MDDCLFCAIVAGDVPAEVVERTERTLTFRDIGPQAPVHLLAVTTAHHADLGALSDANPALLAELAAAAVRAGRDAGLDGGYRVVTNIGDDAGQSVHHVHLHVLGGAALGLFGTPG